MIAIPTNILTEQSLIYMAGDYILMMFNWTES